MAGDDEAGVAVGATRADLTLFDDGNLFTQPGEVKSTGDANGASADDQCLGFTIRVYFGTFKVKFLHFVEKNVGHQDTKTQRRFLAKGFALCLRAFVANFSGCTTSLIAAGPVWI